MRKYNLEYFQAITVRDFTGNKRSSLFLTFLDSCGNQLNATYHPNVGGKPMVVSAGQSFEVDVYDLIDLLSKKMGQDKRSREQAWLSPLWVSVFSPDIILE